MWWQFWVLRPAFKILNCDLRSLTVKCEYIIFIVVYYYVAHFARKNRSSYALVAVVVCVEIDCIPCVSEVTLTLNIEKPRRQKENNTRDSNVVPHRSTNRARACLTSLSRRDAVLSCWYGRSQHEQHFYA